MVRLIALYPHPDDTDAFMQYFEETHLPLTRQLPGLIDLRYGRAVSLTGEPAPHFLTGEMDFSDESALFSALTSDAGQAVVADVPNYSPRGVELHYIVLP